MEKFWPSSRNSSPRRATPSLSTVTSENPIRCVPRRTVGPSTRPATGITELFYTDNRLVVGEQRIQPFRTRRHGEIPVEIDADHPRGIVEERLNQVGQPVVRGRPLPDPLDVLLHNLDQYQARLGHGVALLDPQKDIVSGQFEELEIAGAPNPTTSRQVRMPSPRLTSVGDRSRASHSAFMRPPLRKS